MFQPEKTEPEGSRVPTPKTMLLAASLLLALPHLAETSLLAQAAAAAAASAHAAGENKPQTQTTPPAPSIQVVTREVVLDVTVTDAKGNPVHNLKQEDFTVKEDNKPQPIRSF